MNIIITGDSEVALHLAELLSGENHNVTLVAPDKEYLKLIESHSDLMTMVGDATSIPVLKNANSRRADLLISAHLDGRINLLTAIIGKQLGIKKCIAKVNEPEYLSDECKEHFKTLGIDYLVSPEKIAAGEIANLLTNTAAAEIFDFSDQKLSLMLVKLDEGAPVIGKTLKEIAGEYSDLNFRAVSIHRRARTMIPRGDDKFQVGDMAYVITKPRGIDHLLELSGKKPFEIHNVMIVGGGAVGTHSAALLEKKFNIKLFEINSDRANELTNELQRTLVINGDARNINLLESEGVSSMDAFVAVTNNSETNILTCLLARRFGVKKTIALVENIDFIEISQSVGIDTIINKKLATASYILRFTMTAEVISTKCLTSIDAEVFEFLAKPGSLITRKPIKKLNFPKQAIIGGFIRDNKGFIAKGDMQIQDGDKVVVFALPDAFHGVDKMFKT
ncbi:MAG: Trk system potassium transporter TrkA [Bacteroidales bacterium]|nr:Trk system potassium transporter TrkA [Bacteroidales bacterium]